jgi:protein-L-isoaspartate O-methyltransferase
MRRRPTAAQESVLNLRRRLKRTERSAILGPKENASHLLAPTRAREATELLQLEKTDKVLEVGTGSGYR